MAECCLINTFFLFLFLFFGVGWELYIYGLMNKNTDAMPQKPNRIQTGICTLSLNDLIFSVTIPGRLSLESNLAPTSDNTRLSKTTAVNIVHTSIEMIIGGNFIAVFFNFRIILDIKEVIASTINVTTIGTTQSGRFG